MPLWSPGNLRRHFRKHGPKFPFASIVDYEANSLATIRNGRRFRYTDPESGDPRVGYYDVATNGFTSVSDDERAIVTHFPPRRDEQYCRNLPQSTYV
jgi:hypothetical protein